jgi:peptidoglycan LD-endopeptidase LytH
MNSLSNILERHKSTFKPILGKSIADYKFCKMDFTENNGELLNVDLNNTEKFSEYIFEKIHSNSCDFGIGGYAENRTIYRKSEHFNTEDEPRTIHLGVDIWAPAETPFYTSIDGKVHSFANNNNYGDYGPTIILEHVLESKTFYSLYGHLSLQSIDNLFVGKEFKVRTPLGFIGNFPENGDWPPHLHFQIIDNIGNYFGDYPGVCKLSESKFYLKNCPNPSLVLV